MPISPNHAAPEVEGAVLAHQAAMNNSRFIPDTPEMYREVSAKNRVYIFNVGPWPLARELGSAGTFRIPACPVGEEYSQPIVLNGVHEEPYPINEAECKVLMEDGMALAKQILGEGPFIPRSQSFRPFGVFISKSPKPTEAEVREAKEQLRERYLLMVREADEAYAQGPAKAQEIIRPEWHFVAARALRKTDVECKWLANTQTPADREKCFGCGTVYEVGILKCGCGAVLDKPRYDEAVKKGLFAA